MAKQRTKIILGSVVMAVLAFVTFVVLSARLPKPTIANASGKPAPSFVLPDQNGREFALASEHGHKVLLMFYRGYW